MLPSTVLNGKERLTTLGMSPGARAGGKSGDVSKHLGSALEIEDLSGHNCGFPTLPFPGAQLEELSLHSLNQTRAIKLSAIPVLVFILNNVFNSFWLHGVFFAG